LGGVGDDSAFFTNAQAFKQGVVTKQAGGVSYLLKTAGVTILEGGGQLLLSGS
jgi:dihydrolipoamide dehydrogenase